MGQRTSRVTIGEEGQAVDCHVIAPITHTGTRLPHSHTADNGKHNQAAHVCLCVCVMSDVIERVPSLCVGSSVEAGPVLAMVVTQHPTLQGAIDITLIAQVHTHAHHHYTHIAENDR